MAKVWIVEYDIRGEGGEKNCKSFAEAKIFARDLICKNFEVKEYLPSFRDGNRRKYRAAIADFFEKYFSDPNFPYSEEDIPSGDPDDYEEIVPEGIIFGENLPEDDYETDYEYETLEEYLAEDDLPNLVELYGIDTTEYKYDDLPSFSTNLLLAKEENEEYTFDEEGLFVRIYTRVAAGGSSNPVLILSELKRGRHIDPQIYDYARKYEEAYGPGEKAPMSIRTVYRHIKMLRDLGYVITRKEGGFTLEGKTAPKTNIDFGTSAYPIMLLDVLEEAEKPFLQADIISAILKKYHVSIHRKAIGRLIKGLIDLGYDIGHTREGYTLK